MYVITKTAAWWQESAGPLAGPVTAQSGNNIEALRALLVPASADATQRLTRWAARPLPIHRGKCLALRFEGEAEPQVLIQQRNRREWLPLSQVLGGGQAWQWAQDGFVRPR